VTVAQRILARTEALPARGRLVNAAPADSGGRSVNERDAALLGWLITDGRVTWDAFYPRAMIYQSKEHYVEELRALVGGEAREDFDDRPPRTFPTGHTYAVKRAFRWTLTTASLKALMEHTGVYSRADLIPFVTHLDAPARRAMLDAMLKAEGYRRGGGWVFSQARREVLDVFQILASLEGHALGRERREEKLGRVQLRSSRFTDIPGLRVEPELPEDVWCPTTDYGTCVMRIDGLVSITGNTTRAKNRATADLVGMGEVSAEEIEPAGDDAADQALTAGAPASDELRHATLGALAALVGDPESAREAAAAIKADHGYLPVAAGRALGHAAIASNRAKQAAAHGEPADKHQRLDARAEHADQAEAA
jgi:hypothetical protein